MPHNDRFVESSSKVLSPQLSEDEELWLSFKEGNKEAFSKIYATYFSSLYNYGAKITRDKDLIKDCIQDLFIDLWKGRKRMSATTSIKFYLYKSLRRKMVKEIESTSRYGIQESLNDNYNFEVIASAEFDLITEQVDQEGKKAIINALNSLTRRQKEAIFLKYYENLSSAEVAHIMDLNLNSTYVLLSKAIEVLRKNMIKLPSLVIYLIVLLRAG